MLQTTPSADTHRVPLLFRPGTPDDLQTLHRLFQESIWDLSWRMGAHDSERVPSEQDRLEDLAQWRPIFTHLTESADQFWVAERGSQLLGYPRSILRDGVRELTEFFVSPSAQSDGIGRELVSRALPSGARRALIMGTLNLRAQALYHKLGIYQVCAVYTFHQQLARLAPPQTSSETLPNDAKVPGDLTIVPITENHISMLAKLDQAIHGHRRDADHAWLVASRSGFVLLRDQRAVGYGYVGKSFSGPFVMLDQADFPVALAHAESIAFAQGYANFGVDVPMLNRVAVNYLLTRGYHMSPFFCFYMCSDQPRHVDKTIITGPMIMI